MRNPKKQTFSTLTGEFSSPVTEMLYRRASWQQTKLQLRIIYGICLVGYLAVIIPDYLGLGFSTEWLALTATRLVVSTTFIAVLLETMRRKPGKSLPWVIFTAQVIFAIGEIIQVELSVKAGMMDNVPDLPFVLIAIFIYFAFTENRLLLTLVASLFAGMGGILHMATLMPDPATYALRYSIICLGIILFTYLFMRMLYRIRRAQWIDSRNLAIENQVRLRQEQKLREADRKKDLFLQILNHEMRTPLYGMLGMLESATADDRQDQDAKVETALNSGKVLMQLINDVLDISGDSPDILLREEQDSFSLRQLLATTRQVMENYHHAQPGQLHLHIDPALPDLVHADQTRIQQILYNLLSNAFKYGGGKAIGLAVKPERQSGQVMWISFAVEDNGPGIPQKMQGHIFDAFSRNPDGNDSGIEGLGLRAAYSSPDDSEKFNRVTGGDGLYYLVRWDREGKQTVQGVHQYGNHFDDPVNPHYHDQAEDFANEVMHPTLFSQSEREPLIERRYTVSQPAVNEINAN